MNDLITKPVMDAAKVDIVNEAYELRIDALIDAENVVTVNDVFEANTAATAQKALKHLLTQIEDSRKAVKAPILQIGRNIDAIAKEFVMDVVTEEERIAKLLGAYQRIERDKKVAAQREAMAAENAIMIEQAKKAADGGDVMQPIEQTALDKIAELRNQVADKHDAVAGVKVKTTTKFEVLDAAVLLQARPDLFTPDDRKIRAALKHTKTIPGINVWEETKAY
tara:strand:- start:5310 stop:5978 length:669 start_codon:yes stop_codon:yes gene_type:complete